MEPEALDAWLDRLAELLARSPHNLVARSQREAVRQLHLAEAEALSARLGRLRPGSSWMDLGTGGGLPGLVLARLHPQVRWTLVDSVAKKTAAVAAFAEELRLDNVEVLTGRAEQLARQPAHREAYDGVIARAVAALDVLAELARGFLRPGGVLVAVKGPRWRDELTQADRALRALRLSVLGVEPVDAAVRATWLVTLRAEGPVPTAYPRRVGEPRRHPLGGRPT